MRRVRRGAGIAACVAACGIMAAWGALAQGVEPSPAAPGASGVSPALPGAGLPPLPGAGGSPAPVNGYGMSWREAWNYGGTIMWWLAAMSVFGGALVLYFLAVLRPSQVVPRPLLNELIDRLHSGDAGDARRACESRACPLSAVTLTALDYVRGVSRVDTGLLRDMIEAEGMRQAEDLQSQTQWLLDIAVIAPMLGLLGTVLGMLKAFGSVASDVTAAKPVILAQGVSQAIVTTIFGLIVAIPCMMFYAYFRRRAARLVSQLEGASTEVLTALMARHEP